MTVTRLRVLTAAALLVFPGAAAWGDLVGPAVPLDELTRQSDVIFKGTMGSEKKVEEKAFDYLWGYACYETEFKIVSVVKGKKPAGNVRFRHYDADPTSPRSAVSIGPQVYHFEPGKTYLVFGKKDAAAPGAFQQLWQGPIGMSDEGVVQCRDDRAVEGRTVKEVLWSEWMAQLKSEDTGETLSAIEHLDEFSGGGATKAASYDLNYYFKMVDENPAAYTRPP